MNASPLLVGLRPTDSTRWQPSGAARCRCPTWQPKAGRNWAATCASCGGQRSAGGIGRLRALPSPSSCVVIWAAFLTGTEGLPGTRHFLSAVLEAVQMQLCCMPLRNRWLRGSTQIEFWGQLEITLDLGALTKVCLNPPAFPLGSSFFNHLLMFFRLGHWLMDDVNLPLSQPPPPFSTVHDVVLIYPFWLLSRQQIWN